MIRTKTDKEFDCVEFKNEAQLEIYEQIKGLSPEAQIRYYRDRAASGVLGDWWKRVREQTARNKDESESTVGQD